MPPFLDTQDINRPLHPISATIGMHPSGLQSHTQMVPSHIFVGDTIIISHSCTIQYNRPAIPESKPLNHPTPPPTYELACPNFTPIEGNPEQDWLHLKHAISSHDQREKIACSTSHKGPHSNWRSLGQCQFMGCWRVFEWVGFKNAGPTVQILMQF